LHAQQVIVPPMPGLFSALGLLISGVEHHASRSCRLVGDTLTAAALSRIKDEIQQEMVAQFQSEGFDPAHVSIQCSVDVRFSGQTSEIRIALQGDQIAEATLQEMIVAFEDEHERLYGHRSDPDNPIEVVTVRCIGRVEARDATLVRPTASNGGGPSSRQAWFGRRWGEIETPVVTRQDLESGAAGPLLIDEYDSTIVVPPERSVRVDGEGNVLIEET